MQNVIEKLKCLNYEEYYVKKRRMKPIGHEYFALPDSNKSIQFQNFLELVTWLFSLINGSVNFLQVDEYDDPNTIIEKMLLALKNLDYKENVPASKLKLAYGETTVSVLDFLTDLALDKSGFRFHEIEYPKDEEFDDELKILDETGDYKEDISTNFINEDINCSKSRQEQENHMIVAKINPIEWRTEMERVAPSLRGEKIFETGVQWKHRIQRINQLFQFVHDDDSNEFETRLVLTLEKISSILETIEAKESVLNQIFSNHSYIYETENAALTSAQELHMKLATNVSNLTKKLEHVSREMNDVKTDMDAKANEMTDTAPIIQIKAGLQKLKADNKALDLRIGISNHSLLKYKRLVN